MDSSNLNDSINQWLNEIEQIWIKYGDDSIQESLIERKIKNQAKGNLKYGNTKRKVQRWISDNTWHFRYKDKYYRILLEGDLYFPSSEQLSNLKSKERYIELPTGEVVIYWKCGDTGEAIPTSWYYLEIIDTDSGENSYNLGL